MMEPILSNPCYGRAISPGRWCIGRSSSRRQSSVVSFVHLRENLFVRSLPQLYKSACSGCRHDSNIVSSYFYMNKYMQDVRQRTTHVSSTIGTQQRGERNVHHFRGCFCCIPFGALAECRRPIRASSSIRYYAA